MTTFIQTIYAAFILLLLTIAGCNSSSSTNNNQAIAGVSLSGTVAAGAPLAGGTIVAKDSAGTTVNGVINVDGSYTLAVDTLTSPYILNATGTVGLQNYNLYSVATDTDIAAATQTGTVNVTPLTDVIFANVVGTNSAAFFNNPNFALLTASRITAAATTLKTRLNTMLTAAGIATTTFDLRSSAFVANHTGFDAVLDMLNVSVDATTNKARITNRLDTTQFIDDDLTTETDIDELPVNAAVIQAGVTAIEDIDGLFSDFEHLLKDTTAASRPNLTEVKGYLASSLSHNGYTFDTYSSWIANSTTDNELKLLNDFYDQDFILKSYGATEIIVTLEDGSDYYLANDGSTGWKLDGNHQTTAR